MNDIHPRPDPSIIPRSEHSISRSDISENALKVLYRLHKSGYKAFLVGGGVRDLLLGLHPKDFDIATDAHPEEIRRLFRNSRLIGRRFRLAHVRFGRDIVEVATFRAGSNDSNEDQQQSDSGRILRDNVYGTIEEDIWRRDFTVNALYYNIADYSVWDYTGGIDDLKARTLRLIDDPWVRYREDPVRMLRAARFAAKLEFSIAPDTAAPIRDLGPLLADVPAARLFDETLKLFLSGQAVASFEQLVELDLLQYLFPSAAALLRGEQGDDVAEFIRKGLANTDQRIGEGKSVTPMFLYAVFLWPGVRRLADRLASDQGMRPFEAMQEAIHRVLGEQIARTSLPKRFSVPMKEVLVLQRRFLNRKGVRAARLLDHKRFRAAYDFFVLRSECGEVDRDIAAWWGEAQEAEPDARNEAFDVGGSRRRRRRPRRRPRQDRAPE
ncbi:MAG: polynucleotide adenylyltransferase PcnB [Gammaproteobacteria bacterium]